jgi:hypothetical protein
LQATDVHTFWENAEKLCLEERQLIVDQALALLEHHYVHLPLKRAIHAVDPVQRLKLLKFHLDVEDAPLGSESEFHSEMIEIFTSVRDYHTGYFLPSPFNNRTAFLPFLVEEYFPRDTEEPKYLVSRVLKGFNHPTFTRGVELLYWNGVPIHRAIELNGENQSGSNPAARFACGLDALTIRPLASSLPPDEEWVTITYRSLKGKTLELRKKWLIIPSDDAAEARSSDAAARKRAATQSINFQKDRINRARKLLFNPDAVQAQKEIRNGDRVDYYPTEIETKGPVATRPCGTKMPTIFTAKEVHKGCKRTSKDDHQACRKFGYIRIFTFAPDNDDEDAFVKEFQRLIALFKDSEGLIIDVRNNGGGMVGAGERLLQMLTPRPIEPETFEFINTPLNLSICSRDPEDEGLKLWKDSIARSVQTGATYSDGFPLSDPKECNSIKQQYFGPVVLITDALCYSTTDIFAAGFQDHEIGVILGTGMSTGAGGANVWEHERLMSLMNGQANNPLQQLPKDVKMRVAMRRSRRIGQRSGTPLEEFGVAPDKIHKLSKTDLLYGNIELIKNAVAILSRLLVKPSIDENEMLNVKVTIRTKDVSRLEYTVGGEKKSLDVRGNKVQFSEPVSSFVPPILQLRAFKQVNDKEHLIAVRNMGMDEIKKISATEGAQQMATKSKNKGSKSGPGSTSSSKKSTSKKSSKKSTSKGTSASKGGSGGTISSKSGPGSTSSSKKGTSKKGTSKKKSSSKGESASKLGSGSTVSSKSGPGSTSSNKNSSSKKKKR